MKKTSYFIWILIICVLCVVAFVFYNAHKKNTVKPQMMMTVNDYEAPEQIQKFSDGLHNADSITRYDLDEFDIGVSEKSIYYVDINQDGIKDRITKTFTQTGNAHSYYSYKIELKKGDTYIDITPNNLRTTNGASCDLQQIQFIFQPTFKITIISRELGDTWPTPTMAYRQEYGLTKENKLTSSTRQKIRPICDVKELF